MRNLRWICWYLWEGLPTLLAFPIESSNTRDPGDFWSSQWENHWLRYGIGTLGFVVVAFTLAGCLCCRKQRRPKGFQDDAGNGKEFKDGSTAGTETTIERVPSANLELEVPRIQTIPSINKISHNEISTNFPDTRITIKPPSPSLFFDDADTTNNLTRSIQQPCSDWFEAANFPREKLKYLREIGRGWFGKVVEGTTELDAGISKNTAKNRGVVVRILTEEATSSEKSWFLGESTPYLKLRHSNILELLGSCLETDPYLLLFESCPAGDLKNFLLTNRENADALRRENLPTRLAINIADALEHMHDNGFAHTDLSARNCLVAPDLTAKLGDYGTGVEKYPGDYYVVGDRALPIRWSAPESLECTETTIETRSITPRANLWSYGVLLWEIASWAERPYDDLGDEQVIESIFSRKSDFANDQNSRKLLKKLLEKSTLPTNFRDSVVASWKFLPTERASLREIREALCGKRIEDFESRWENLRPNGTTSSVDKSASLRDLRGSVDSERWQASASEEKKSVANFRLGPEEPVINCPRENTCLQESGSETEEESWRGRVERGAYTEKVKQKSKSVADLMILVHIDSDSDGEISLGPQTTEKSVKKRLPASGSDGDLRSAVIADEFDEALRKLREPSSCYAASMKITENIGENGKIGENTEANVNIVENLEEIGANGRKSLEIGANNAKNVKIGENDMNNEKIGVHLAEIGENIIGNMKIGENNENGIIVGESTEDSMKIGKNIGENMKIGDTQKLLTLTHQGQTPILRLSFRNSGESTSALVNEKPQKNVGISSENRHEESAFETNAKNPAEISKSDSHVLRLVSKEDPNSPLLCYVSERTSTPTNLSENPSFDSFLVLESRDAILSCSSTDKNNVDVQSWNEALAHELEKKNPFFVESSSIFDETLEGKMIFTDPALTPVGKENFDVKRSKSAPNTPKSLQNRRVGEKIGKEFVIASSSAPETPQRNYSSSSIDTIEESRKTGKNVNYYRDDEDIVTGSSSAPETPFRSNYGMENIDEDSSACEELEPGMMKRTSNEADDEEDRKHLSTPDDERSSDSGFRDKESCEEEESPIPGPQVSSIILGNSSLMAGNSSPLSASAEEEQMRILFELDTILDAEYYGNYGDKNDDMEISLDNAEISFTDRDEVAEKIRSISESLESTDSTEIPETVRANSCGPNFLENFLDKSEEETNFEIFRNVGNFGAMPENTEADSVSEVSKFEENRLSSNKEDLLADSSSESPLITDNHPSTDSPLKTDKHQSADSSSELARLNFDSSSSRGKTTSNETTDFSLELRSDFDKNLSNSDSSPLKTDRNSSTDFSLDLRLNETSDSISPADKTDLKNVTISDNAAIHGEDSPNSADKADRTGSILENTETSSGSAGKADSTIFPLSETSEIFEENSLAATDQTARRNLPTVETSKIHQAENSASPVGKENRKNFQESQSNSFGKETRRVVSLSECSELWDEYSLASVSQADRDSLPVGENSEIFEEFSSIESPIKTDRQTSDFSVDIQRENSDVEQWSSRENVNENDDEDSSTISLRSDNSYVSFGLDEEFVAAIRNELREKLPRAQMPVIEALDPHDEKESTSINAETKNWDDEEIDENPERTSVDISIRYNIYGTPLSPIMEERESAGTSESLVSKEDSGDASIASKVSALSEDVLVVDTRTNRAMIVEGGANGENGETLNLQQEDDRDTSHGDFSDDENLEYSQNNLSRGLENKRISMGSGGAPLPSPEEESKWQQQFPLPLQMQDDLMSTSFGTDRDWDSQDDEEGEDEVEDGDDDEEENSSSSGEFVWKRYDESHGDLENVATRSPPNKPKSQEPEVDDDDDEEDNEEENEDEEEEEEFTPSAWDATLAPHRSALRSPEKNLKSGDQKKSVWFKKQRYHCVYEYPKETPVVEGQGQTAATWEPTSYADWEEMMDEPRLDVYPMEYDETNRAGDEEFYVSSSNRPFQFQSGEGKYVSQFFPGASSSLLQHESQQQQQQISSSSSSSSREIEDLATSQDEVDRVDGNSLIIQSSQTNGNSRGMEIIENQQQTQLGELRHTRDRLKLNLLSTSGTSKIEEETGNVKKIEENVEGMEENSSKTEENARKMKEIGEKMEEIDAKEEEIKEKLVKVEENLEETEGALKVYESAGKIEEKVKKLENSRKIEENEEKIEGNADKIEENPGKIEDDSRTMMGNASKMEDAGKVAENISKIEENVGKSLLTEKLLPISEKSYDKEETAEVLKKDDPKIEKIEVSSNSNNLDNLAVKESSKTENNEGKMGDDISNVEKSSNISDRDIEKEKSVAIENRGIETEKSTTIDNRNIEMDKSIIDDEREDTKKSSCSDRTSMIRDNDENINESTSRSRENSETNGDQNSSRSGMKNGKEDKILDIPKLENDENLLSYDESVRGEIVGLETTTTTTTTTNNSSNKVENIDDDETKNVESLSKS